MEQWRACTEYAGYEVSNYGRVREIESGRFLSPVLSGIPQYFSVNIHPNIKDKDRKKRKLVRVHRLVAKEWCTGESEERVFVDHADINPYNNNSWNLRWATHTENMNNTPSNVFIFGEPLKTYCQRQQYQTSAYHYLWRLLNKGIHDQRAVEQYQEYLTHPRKKKTIKH